MGLQEEFEAIAEEAKHVLPPTVTNEEKLDLYGLFKQAHEGDNTHAKPGFLDFAGKAKWEAWEKQKGKSKEQAMQDYIDHVNGLKAKYVK